MTTPQYITSINQKFLRGNATEHTFRGDLAQLIENLAPGIKATNEPKRQACGAPDYIVTRKDVPVGFIETKNIGDRDLEGARKTGNKDQFDRYKASLENMIFTDYLDFHLYRDGKFAMKVAIAELTDKGIKPIKENFASFEALLNDFCTYTGQTIKSSKRLAEIMAAKARLLSGIIETSLESDEDNLEDSSLKDQMNAFKQVLIHDIKPKEFADVYAQTIAYGMFAARLHDQSLDNFSRQEAAELIPKSNPFLRRLFGYIAGPDIDDRIKWIVDSLADVFLHCNVDEILKTYGKETKTEDPIIHFYETFLSAYDPKLRKARGVWYTPQPVVSFIVRAVDDILKTEFGLPQGLADSSKTNIKVEHQGKKIDKEVHRVQILDPATGTGTFLVETIRQIHRKFEGQQGIWSNYVETHLLPRLNGFELLMASYAMAHLKLDLLLTETGYKPTTNQRFRVYLTNSLEEHHQDTGTLFANWLSTEANEANHIKRDTPVMCVIGNPPYAVSSTNKNDWIDNLIADYKKDLNEKSYNSLSDDYVKFIRYGQHFIEKNGSGVLAYISNNSFIDGLVFRKMRKHLLECFDKIYILDLHGNAKKKEVCPDGSADQNVFDIMQGVSINIFIKTGNKKKNELGQLFNYDLYGKRDFKYDFLNENNLKSLKWKQLEFTEPNFFFVPKNFDEIINYEKGFQLKNLFPINGNGVKSNNDYFLIDFTKELQEDKIRYFIDEKDDNLIYSKLKLQNGKYWDNNREREKLLSNTNIDFGIKKYLYRPFDFKYIYYQPNLIEIGRGGSSRKVMLQMKNDNFSIITCKQFAAGKYFTCYITNKITDMSSQAFAPYNLFPLYLYPETNGQQTIDQITERTPNLKPEIVAQIAEKLGLVFTPEPIDYAQGNTRTTFAPIDLLDYIYAVLHSPAYREKYKEFLKIDFPRVPYPDNQESFWQLVRLGGELRQIHLLESPLVDQYITSYPIEGTNEVERPTYKNGNVYINDTQYFGNVPQVAWDFYIGGYQPAQKWLKDRKGRTLEFNDILHYQKIIVALTETDRLMREVDEVGF